MADHTQQSSVAALISQLAEECHVHYAPTASDKWAHHVTRLVDTEIMLDNVENTLIALQRAGRLSRRDMIRLQAQYLREIKP